MKTRIIFTTVLLSLFLLSISACITIKVGDKEKTAEPTMAPKVEPTAVVIQPTAAQAVQPTAAPKGQLELSDLVYTSDPPAFSFKIPKDWTAVFDQPLWVVYQAPDQSGSIIVTAIHTGVALSDEAFAQLINTNLNMNYANVTDYKELHRDEAVGSLLIKSSFVGGDGKPRVSIDIFDRRDTIVYYLTQVAYEDKWEAYSSAFQTITSTSGTNPSAVPVELMYSRAENFSDADGLFSIRWPLDWTVIPDDGSLGSGITFTGFSSPDRLGGMILTRKNYTLKPSNAQRAADGLILMKEHFGKDLRVAYHKILKDGRDRLDWWSDKNKTSGVTWIDTRGKSIILVSVVWDDEVEAVFKPYLESLAATYSYE